MFSAVTVAVTFTVVVAVASQFVSSCQLRMLGSCAPMWDVGMWDAKMKSFLKVSCELELSSRLQLQFEIGELMRENALLTKSMHKFALENLGKFLVVSAS